MPFGDYIAMPFDSDFYLRSAWVHASTDQLVERLNNDWQSLWRATNGKIPLASSAWKKLDQRTALWIEWKAHYDDAIFRRAADPFDWLGRDYDDELRTTWVPFMQDSLQALAQYSPEVAAALEASPVPDSLAMVTEQVNPPHTQDKAINWGLWVGVGMTIGLIGAGAWLARSR